MFAALAGLFGGPAGVVTGWFTSMFGKIIGVLAIVGIISGIGASIYFSWSHTIREAEDNKLRVKQQVEVIKNKEAEIKQLNQINDLREKTLADQVADNAKLSLQNDSVQAWLAQRDSSKDGLSSKVLRDTFSRLYGTRK